MKTLVAVCLVAAAVVAGCGSSRSVLYAGITPSLGGTKVVVSDVAAVRDARSMRAGWVSSVQRESGHRLPVRIAALRRRTFRSRLAAAARQDGFTVERVEFLNPRRPTPLVVVQTSQYVAFARAVPAIERSLDPHRGKNDSTGWSFPAFYLEARDERGVPFLVVDNVVGPGGFGGGQWARSDPLFPFLRL